MKMYMYCNYYNDIKYCDNNIDQDQMAPSRSNLIKVYTVCFSDSCLDCKINLFKILELQKLAELCQYLG